MRNEDGNRMKLLALGNEAVRAGCAGAVIGSDGGGAPRRSKC